MRIRTSKWCGGTTKSRSSPESTVSTHQEREISRLILSTAFHKTIKPYHDIYIRDIAPYLSQAYSYSLTASAASYTFYVEQVHPRAVDTVQNLHAFYVNHADPAMRRTYSLYVRPQVEKLLAKLYERKAHAVTSEVLKETRAEAEEAAAKAEASIPAAEEKAADQEAAPSEKQDSSNTEEEQDAENTALLDAELDAELESVKEQLEAWENGLRKLLMEEYKLYTERIAELRNGRMADLPDHFDAVMNTSKEQVASIVERVGNKYDKFSATSEDGETKSADTRREELSKLIEMPLRKLRQSRSVAEQAVQSYADTLEEEEYKASNASASEIRRFTKEAVKAFHTLMEEVKFERSVEDYEGWDKGMQVRSKLFAQELRDLRLGKDDLRQEIGAVDPAKQANLTPHLEGLRLRIEKLYTDAASQIESYGRESPLTTVEAAVASVRKQATSLSEQAARSMQGAALTARARLGWAPKETPGILERIEQRAGEETDTEDSPVANAVKKDASYVIHTAQSGAAAVQEAIDRQEASRNHGTDSVGPEETPRSEPFSEQGTPTENEPAEPEPVSAPDTAKEPETLSEQLDEPLPDDAQPASDAYPAEPQPVISIQPVKAEGDGVDEEGNTLPVEPQPVISIQPVKVEGDGVDEEGNEVTGDSLLHSPSETASADTKQPSPWPEDMFEEKVRHEEL